MRPVSVRGRSPEPAQPIRRDPTSSRSIPIHTDVTREDGHGCASAAPALLAARRSSSRSAAVAGPRSCRRTGSIPRGTSATSSRSRSRADGKTLVTAGADGLAKLWDVGRRTECGPTSPGTRARSSASRSRPTARRVATGGEDRTVRLWDVGRRRSRWRTLAGHSVPSTALAFSPDGKTLASGEPDTTIRLWDVAAQQAARGRSRGTSGRPGLAFAPDGKTLASASRDRTVKLWDVAGGTERSDPGPARRPGAGASPSPPTARPGLGRPRQDRSGSGQVERVRNRPAAAPPPAVRPARTQQTAGLARPREPSQPQAQQPHAPESCTHGDVVAIAFAPDGRTPGRGPCPTRRRRGRSPARSSIARL